MDLPEPVDQNKPDISSYDATWEKWRTEQVQTITQILSSVFKVEDEARQMQAPSRLLRRSSASSPQEEEEIRTKLKELRQQISEYEEMLKIGLQRIEKALGDIDPAKAATVKPPEEPLAIPKKEISRLKKLVKKLSSSLHLSS